MIREAVAQDETFTLSLGEVSEKYVGRWAVQIYDLSGTWSIQPQGKIKGADSTIDFASIGYIDAADLTAKSAALAANAIIFLDSHGLDCQIVATRTSGTCSISARPVVG